MKNSDVFLNELLEEVQGSIEAARPLLPRGQCNDDYEHGHRNGVFFTLVHLRRSLKEHLATETPDLFAPTK